MLQENLTGLQHIGIPVLDLEKSKYFYAKLGFQEIMSKTLSENNGNTLVSMMELNQLVIELYQLSGAEYEEIVARTNGHIDHLALNVRDIEKAYSEIKAEGFEILEGNAPVFLPFFENGVKFFTIKGPAGEKVEFNQIL